MNRKRLIQKLIHHNFRMFCDLCHSVFHPSKDYCRVSPRAQGLHNWRRYLENTTSMDQSYPVLDANITLVKQASNITINGFDILQGTIVSFFWDTQRVLCTFPSDLSSHSYIITIISNGERTQLSYWCIQFMESRTAYFACSDTLMNFLDANFYFLILFS